MMSVAIATKPLIQNPVKTVAEFEMWLGRQSGLSDKRFEFVRGRIIEKPGMKQNELFIVTFLLDLFLTTNTFKNKKGRLIPELDSYLDNKRKRIPDIAYFTQEQVKGMRRGEKFSSPFTIEVISPNDKFLDIEEKIADYFDANVKLVWCISPKQQQIYVYTSPTEVKIYKGSAVCSAKPVLSDFSFKVENMFAE